MAPKSIPITATALALLARAQAQYTDGSSIASCADFDCNVMNNNTAQCEIQDRTYSAIGAVPFKTPFDSSTNLTWTEGSVFAYPNGLLKTTFVRDFFLGMPPGLDLREDNGFHGCAAFFVDSNASFPLYKPPGTCDDTLGDGCARALQDQAGDVITDDSNISSAEELCTRMEEAFSSDSPPSACSQMSLNGESFGRIKFRPLTGPSAPTPPTKAQKSSTNCHPTLNTTSSYSLAHTLTFNATRGSDPLWNSSLHAIYDEYHPPSQPDGDNIYKFIQHQAIPILTVFTGDAGVHTEVSCLEAPIEFSQSETATDDEGAAGRREVSMGVLGSGLLLSALSCLL